MPASIRFPPASWRAVADVVEPSHAVGLGPHAHRAGLLDVFVPGFDVELAVEQHADFCAAELHAQGVQPLEILTQPVTGFHFI